MTRVALYARVSSPRQAQTQTIEQQLESQRSIRALEATVKRARREIFTREEEIETKRDRLIDDLAVRLQASTEVRELFRIRWRVR